MSAVCPICINNIKSNRVCECPFCKYTTCKECLSTYLLYEDNVVRDPHCMNCRAGWTREHLATLMGQDFIDKKWKKYRQDILFERAKARHPIIQRQMRVKAYRLCLQQDIEESKLKLFRMRRELDALNNVNVLPEAQDITFDVDKEMIAIQMYAEKLKSKIKTKIIKKTPAAPTPTPTPAPDALVPAEEDSNIMNGRCVNEECRGFMNKGKCGMCGVKVCKKCKEVMEDGHKCNEDVLQTLAMIRKDCKHCPNPACQVLINKISGCDQMWCTECHSVFSWRTGKLIETTAIHNPHYYDWMFRTGNNTNIQQQQRPMCQNDVVDIRWITSQFPRDSDVMQLLVEAHRRIVEITDWRNMAGNNIHDRNDLQRKRMKQEDDHGERYLLKLTDEQMYKKRLQEIEKNNEKEDNIINVKLMLKQASDDIFRQLTRNDANKASDVYRQLNQLREHFNDAMLGISNLYSSCVVPQLSVDWKETTNLMIYKRQLDQAEKDKKNKKQRQEDNGTSV